MLEIVSYSKNQTEKIGENLACGLMGNEVIALFGDLGAGKTTFVRGLCSVLGVEDDVCSPTFAILNEYVGKFNIYHFDMYRINSVHDLHSTGYFDYLEKGILIIEWSENIISFLPKDSIKINILYGKNQDERILRFEGLSENIKL